MLSADRALQEYWLALSGAKTLLIERGGWPHRDDSDWDARAILLDKRYKGASPVDVNLYGNDRESEFANETVGGMSVFYGGASLRLRHQDFDRWPIAYDDLSPFYYEAERLLGVHGDRGVDPTEPASHAPYPHTSIPPTDPAERIQDAARALGHKPFPIPLAINFTDESRPTCLMCTTCDGYPCRVEAKNDLTTTILKRAQDAGLELVAGCVAIEFEHQAGVVRSVVCVDKTSGTAVTYTADRFVVAAGAIQTPAILLRSGLAHPFVGRCLMRHCNVIVSCVFPFRTNPKKTFHKQTCLTDFYEKQRDETGLAVGVIQDIYTPDPVVMKAHAPAWGKWVIGVTHSYMQNLLCVAEDEPREENRVEIGEARDAFGLAVARVTHDYTQADWDRSNILAQGAKAILQEAGGRFPYRYVIDSFSHAVGSVRAGTDEDNSATDAFGRLHRMDNLYVADGSFFPTSGGVNPSLTIAANALRIGTHLSEGEA